MKTLSGRWVVSYQSLKTKENSSWVIPKVVAVAYGIGPLRELFITKFKWQFKWGFIKVIITRACHLRECLQGELWLYLWPCTGIIKTSALPYALTLSNYYEPSVQCGLNCLLSSSGKQTAMEICLAGSSVFPLLVRKRQVQAQHHIVSS